MKWSQEIVQYNAPVSNDITAPLKLSWPIYELTFLTQEIS